VTNSPGRGLVVALINRLPHRGYLPFDQRIEGYEQRIEIHVRLDYPQRMHARFNGR